MRLDKYLAEMGAGTRSDLKKAVRSGRVTVNGQRVRDAAMHVSEEDEICLDGNRVVYERFVYYMMNKPAGVISATEDARDRTVLDLIEGRQRKGLFPVGRLDRDTEGLLLIRAPRGQGIFCQTGRSCGRGRAAAVCGGTEGGPYIYGNAGPP